MSNHEQEDTTQNEQQREYSPVDPEVFTQLLHLTTAIERLEGRMTAMESRPSTSNNLPPMGYPYTHMQQNQGGNFVNPQNQAHEYNYEGANEHFQHAPARRGGRRTTNAPRFRNVQEQRDRYQADSEGHDDEEEGEWEAMPQHRIAPRRGVREEDGVGKIKVKIPSFEGKCDPDVYLEWETKIEQIWNCHHFGEEKKVQLAVLEFNGYALIWWDNLVKERRRNLDPAVSNWEQMKAIMRARFIPQHHNRELRQRLESLRQ